MNSRNNAVRPAGMLLATCVLSALSVLGCHQAPVNPSAQASKRPSAWVTEPIPDNAPRVFVEAGNAPLRMESDVEYFASQIRANLTSLGGLRVLDTPAPQCLQNDAATPLVQLNHSLPPEDFEPQITWNADTIDGLTFRVIVSILEFHPYRPVHLQTEIRVVDLSTGYAVVIPGVWKTLPDPSPIADADCGLRKELKHPLQRSKIEAATLHRHSSRTFLAEIAAKMAPAVHAACQVPSPEGAVPVVVPPR